MLLNDLHLDALLRQAVAQYGDNENWKIIAAAIAGRTNKACRKVSQIMYR